MAQELKPFINIGPGEFIKEELEERGWTQEDLAEILGISLKSVNQIIKNKQGITIDKAKLLSKSFGQSPQYWLNLDTNYRLREHTDNENTNDVEIKSIIYKYMPIKEMIQKEWIKSTKTVESLVQQVVDFWQIQSLDFKFLEKQAASLHFRKSDAYRQFNIFFALTWFQQARRIVKTISAESFNRERLNEMVDTISQYTVHENGVEQFLHDLNETGIKFFVLNHLQKTYIDAASFYDQQNPVIVYTARYDRIDNFWFTIAHEIAHILNDLKHESQYFIDDVYTEPVNAKEKKANEFASNILKHEDIFKHFRPLRKYISEFRVKICAETLGIHPGIVVGALQYKGWLSPRNLNKFKDKVKPYIAEKYWVK